LGQAAALTPPGRVLCPTSTCNPFG
jgi:hypothetical protein